ncbi:hypothetical protein [Schnuerera ultunensis]|nr:hypothetical protein [Schnuerera ultunensis]
MDMADADISSIPADNSSVVADVPLACFIRKSNSLMIFSYI